MLPSGGSTKTDKRVVFVLPSLEGGGAERVSLAYLAGALTVSPDLHLILFRRQGALLQNIPAGVEVHDLGCSRLRDSLPSLLRLIRRLRPAVVYSTHGYVNILLLALRPIYGQDASLLLREANTPSSSLAGQRFTSVFRIAYRALYPRVDALVCQSRLMADELHRDFRVSRNRLHLIYNPIDTFGIRDGIKKLRVAGDGVRFLAAGLFNRKKGFDRLLEWFAQLPSNAHLTILGKGSEESNLRGLVATLGLGDRVVFPGYIPRPWNYFAGADAFLLPSRWEGMPNVALEALAVGTPVIAMMEAGGIGEVAALALPGAVRLATNEQEFVAQMRSVVIRDCEIPGASLLPGVFNQPKAQMAFNLILASLLSQSKDKV
jgi:glycosyltransferase involved in cell wall biosynthesis